MRNLYNTLKIFKKDNVPFHHSTEVREISKASNLIYSSILAPMKFDRAAIREVKECQKIRPIIFFKEILYHQPLLQPALRSWKQITPAGSGNLHLMPRESY
ncbi:hypothetical protein RF11_02075 [Thelohanellus kitauei]|uniref:Uncharacterized protein n=1 Tax=Thelohanellus kitauei TaxID=669202 RepID=A0A0C2MGY8_THEKT|nr:hypothetical protein RF11_02075 [Thelohanellus kitauei]